MCGAINLSSSNSTLLSINIQNTYAELIPGIIDGKANTTNNNIIASSYSNLSKEKESGYLKGESIRVLLFQASKVQ